MPVERIDTPLILPDRPADAHKGTFGRALIIGGSRGMAGAVGLSGLSALRGGAGLVFLAVPTGIQPVVAGYEPSYQVAGLPEDASGRFAASAMTQLRSLVERQTVVAIGPGLGQSDAVRSLVREFFLTAALPVVLDADAINALAVQPDVWKLPIRSLDAPRILTPHPGEFARLTGTDCPKDDAGREAAAVRFAGERGVILLLKGRRTLITDGKRLAVNSTGNSGMATGGTGDVLTGLIASLVAQGLESFHAARLGAHLHGLAGDLAAEELSEPGLIASDLPRYLGRAWKRLSNPDAARTTVEPLA
ncbi:MAG: NAD(P)H-hydrate dehydratase [Planctomycetaceae bacterium]|nr:NAD(P)H-hydrate dehydratase [Planctomycetaceae bacterium]